MQLVLNNYFLFEVVLDFPCGEVVLSEKEIVKDSRGICEKLLKFTPLPITSWYFSKQIIN